MKKLPRFYISKGFAVVLSAAVCFDSENMLVPTLVSAALHEMAHFAAVYMCGGSVESVCFTVYGAYISLCRYPMMGYLKEFIVAAAGPCASIFAAFVFSVLGNMVESDAIFMFSGINFMLAIINLIPAYPLDGGRMLRCVMFMLCSADRAENVCKIFSGICAFISVVLCVWINIRFGFQLFVTIFSVFTVLSFFKNSRIN